MNQETTSLDMKIIIVIENKNSHDMILFALNEEIQQGSCVTNYNKEL